LPELPKVAPASKEAEPPIPIMIPDKIAITTKEINSFLCHR
jgi:hypothetical protein